MLGLRYTPLSLAARDAPQRCALITRIWPRLPYLCHVQVLEYKKRLDLSEYVEQHDFIFDEVLSEACRSASKLCLSCELDIYHTYWNQSTTSPMHMINSVADASLGKRLEVGVSFMRY